MTREQSGQGQVVVVFGATGTAGSGAVQAGLDEPGVSRVRAIARRPLCLSHDKLEQIMCSDFVELASVAQQLRGVDCCLFCLGTSVKNVDGEAQYREIHVTYALAAARALRAGSPDTSFVYLSGAGTRRTSRMMWARVKAEAEDWLAELQLARHADVRPAAILPLQPRGASRWLLAPLLKVIPALGIGALELGRAMLRLGLDRGWCGSRTLENRELKALLGAGTQR